MLNILQDDGMPLYRQLKDALRKRILKGEWKRGEKIPSEFEICAEYSVSRVTVRNAVAELESEQLLVRKQGKGTFVSQQKIERKIEHLASFTSACKVNNLIASAIIMKCEVIAPNPEQQLALKLPKDDKIIYIQRLRLANGDPIMIENNYFSFQRFSFLLSEQLDGSLYELLKTKYGIILADSAQNPPESPSTSIEVMRAVTEHANLLQVPVGTPLFHIKTIIHGEDHIPIHIGNQFIRGDRYLITIP